MTRYRGIERAALAARTRRLETESRQRDEQADPTTLNDSILSGAIYRLQTRNRTGRFSDRIKVLVAEQQRRRES